MKSKIPLESGAKAAYSVEEFLSAYGICRGTLENPRGATRRDRYQAQLPHDGDKLQQS